MGFINPLAQPARGRRADRSANGEGRLAMAGTIEIGPPDQRGGQARREILVLPVGPGFRLRQILVGADADARYQKYEDSDRPEPPRVDGSVHGRQACSRWT